MTTQLEKVIADTDWLPHALDTGGDNLTFVHVPRIARDTLTFLSDEHYKGNYPKLTFPMREVADGASNLGSVPPNMIFHTSFCASTLLSRALDVDGRATALREPDVLLYLANLMVRDGEPKIAPQLGTILQLLARASNAGESVIVKPSNFANRLAAPVLRQDPKARAVLLYSSLPTLLRSLAKKGIWGRIYGRKLYRNLIGWTSLDLGFGPVETFEQTDLQIAGLAWLMHMHHFHQIAREFGPSQVMALNSDEFLASVEPTLQSVARFFNIGLDGKQLAAIAAGPVFSVHSKLSGGYSPEDRDREHAAVDAAHGVEFDAVCKWISAVSEHVGMSLQPSLLSR